MWAGGWSGVVWWGKEDGNAEGMGGGGSLAGVADQALHSTLRHDMLQSAIRGYGYISNYAWRFPDSITKTASLQSHTYQLHFTLLLLPSSEGAQHQGNVIYGRTLLTPATRAQISPDAYFHTMPAHSMSLLLLPSSPPHLLHRVAQPHLHGLLGPQLLRARVEQEAQVGDEAELGVRLVDGVHKVLDLRERELAHAQQAGARSDLGGEGNSNEARMRRREHPHAPAAKWWGAL